MTTRERCVGIAVLVVAMGASLPGAEPSASPSSGRDPLVLLGDKDFPPSSFVERGLATGVDIDVARALSKVLGREVRVELMEWCAAQRRVLRGEADGVLSLTPSADRRRLYDFTEPFTTRDFGFFVRNGEGTIREVSDLAGKAIGVTEGGLPRQLLRTSAAANLVLIDHYEDGFSRLEGGTIDAVAADLQVGAYTLERRHFRNIVRAGHPFAMLESGIAIPKGHQDLVDEINHALQVLRQTGEIERIQQRWRPKEMVFLSRDRLNWLLVLGATSLCGMLMVVSGVWRKRRRAAAGAAVGAMRTTVPAGIAHDFNNFLQIIRGHSELALLQVGPTSGVRENLEEIKAAADMATSLTRQLVPFKKNRVVRPVVVDLNEVVTRMTKMLERLVGYEVEVRVRRRVDPAHVTADMNDIERIILNLVINARDAMPKGGTLTLETNATRLDDERFLREHDGLAAGEFVTLTVSDTGIGITPDVRDSLFVPFFTTKGPGRGTGLGLSTAREILRQAGGCIVVDSAPALGATFTIYLPKRITSST